MSLHLAGEDRADQLLSEDPLALLIGLVLDQQIPLERAFRAPLELVHRLGLSVPIDAAVLAGMDPERVVEAFARKPSVHRYPTSMASRVQELARRVADDHGGDVRRIWSEARDGEDLRRRVQSLPGFGERKARIFVALAGKQLGVRPAGWVDASAPFGVAGTHLSAADVVDDASLAEVRRRKKADKRAAAQSRGKPNPSSSGSGLEAAPRRSR